MNEVTPLKKGNLYKIRSRNLPYGVYDGRGGFIGVREKFGSLYLFTEYDRDNGGTVIAVREDLGPIPEGIEPVEAWWTTENDNPSGRGYVVNTALYKFLAEAEKKHGRGTRYEKREE